MSIAPARYLHSDLAARFVVTVLVLAAAAAALVVIGWVVIEVLSPSGSVPHAPGPLPLPSPALGPGGL